MISACADTFESLVISSTAIYAGVPTFVVIDLPKARAPKVFAKSPWPQLQPAPMLGVPSLVGVFATEEYVKVSPVTGNRLEGGHYNDKTHSDGSWKNANTVFGATSGSDTVSTPTAVP